MLIDLVNNDLVTLTWIGFYWKSCELVVTETETEDERKRLKEKMAYKLTNFKLRASVIGRDYSSQP